LHHLAASNTFHIYPNEEWEIGQRFWNAEQSRQQVVLHTAPGARRQDSLIFLDIGPVHDRAGSMHHMRHDPF
jgi:hypothetical protein